MNQQSANHDIAPVPGRSLRSAQRTQPIAPIGAALSAVLICALLAGCGGGGGGGGNTGNHPAAAPTPPAPPQSTLGGNVAPTSSPVTVTVQLTDPTQPDKTVSHSATPDAAGAFTISAPTSSIPKNSQVAAIVSAPGYMPTTVIYSTDAAGTLTFKSATNVLGTQTTAGPITLARLTTGTFSFTGLDTLHRLGDGSAGGVTNSLLQLPPPPKTGPQAMKASDLITNLDPTKSQLEVSLLIRGLEVSICPGAKATLRSFDAARVELPVQDKPLVDSPASGDFGPQTHTFAINPAVLLSGSIQLEIRTGECGDIDDMEFVGTTGTLL